MRCLPTLFLKSASQALKAPSRIWDGPSERDLLIFTNVDGGRRQHLIVGVENEPPRSDRGMKFYLFVPIVCATAIQSDSLFLCTRQKAREHSWSWRGHLRSAEVTHTHRGRIQACKSKGLSYLQRYPHDGRLPLSVDGGFSNVKTCKANGAPSETFRGLSKDIFGLIATNADRALRSPEERLSEGVA